MVNQRTGRSFHTGSLLHAVFNSCASSYILFPFPSWRLIAQFLFYFFDLLLSQSPHTVLLVTFAGLRYFPQCKLTLAYYLEHFQSCFRFSYCDCVPVVLRSKLLSLFFLLANVSLVVYSSIIPLF